MRSATTWAVAVALGLGVSGSAWAQRAPGSAPAAAPSAAAHVSFTNLNFHQGTAPARPATHTSHSGNTPRPNHSTQGSSSTRSGGGIDSVAANDSYGGYNYP